MTTTTELPASEIAEAWARRVMARRAALPETWEFRESRRILLVEVDEALATFNEVRG